MSERPLHPGPGPKGSPRRTVVARFSRSHWSYAKLDCGHSVLHTKQFECAEGVKVNCGQCPRRKKK